MLQTVQPTTNFDSLKFSNKILKDFINLINKHKSNLSNVKFNALPENYEKKMIDLIINTIKNNIDAISKMDAETLREGLDYLDKTIDQMNIHNQDDWNFANKVNVYDLTKELIAQHFKK